ncbi:hypothetical protein ACXONR_09645, partial [Streptococcus thermophilus]
GLEVGDCRLAVGVDEGVLADHPPVSEADFVSGLVESLVTEGGLAKGVDSLVLDGQWVRGCDVWDCNLAVTAQSEG